MKIFVIPGINGLGKTMGCEGSYRTIFKRFNYKKIDLSLDNLSEQLSDIKNFSRKHVLKKALFFGGDHSISFPLVSSLFERYREETKLIIFDAHFDMMKPLKEPTHEEWLRALIELGFPTENIMLIGVRSNSENIDALEEDYALKKGVKVIYSEFFNDSIDEIIKFSSSGKIYLSLDIDVFDKGFISSTGYPEGKGLYPEDFLRLLKKIKENIFWGDIVEINLQKGSSMSKENTINTARKILKVFVDSKQDERS